MNNLIKNLIKNLGARRNALYEQIDDTLNDNIYEIIEAIANEKHNNSLVSFFDDGDNTDSYVKVSFECAFNVSTKELFNIPVTEIYMVNHCGKNVAVRLVSPASEDIDFEEIDPASKLIIVEYIINKLNL